MAEAIPSPGGDLWFRLVPLDGQEPGRRSVRLEVGGSGTDPPYVSRVTWPEWFALDAAWDDRERVWVASADSGVNVFAQRDGEWRRFAWEEGIDASRRSPLDDVGTGESVEWLDAAPPPGLRP